MRILTPLLTALTLGVLFTAGAQGCVPGSTPATAEAAGYYVYQACADGSTWEAQEECMYWGPWNVWVYEESNGIAGLQRYDEMRDDTCRGQVPGDTIVF